MAGNRFSYFLNCFSNRAYTWLIFCLPYPALAWIQVPRARGAPAAGSRARTQFLLRSTWIS
jgi:hypothetical protein